MTAAAADPDALARRCAQAMYDADAASRSLGMAIMDVGAGHATVRMTITPSMVNGHGIGHGGYTFMLADSAFAFACNTYDVATVAASCDIVFISPTRAGDVLEATATERHRTARRGVYDVTVIRISGDSAGDVVAEFRGVGQSSREPVLGRAGEAEGTPTP
jgi:acyl-CoA thioesterase